MHFLWCDQKLSARWRRGYAAACKAVNTGSIPVRASSLVTVCVEHLIGSSSVVEQVAVNHLVGGSNPSSRANKINGLDVYSSSPFFI
jgi:hypothetical protein